MKKNFLVLISFLFSALLFIEGCAPSKPVQVERTIAADRLIKRLEANRRKIKDFSASGTISVKTDEIDTKSNFQIEIKKPDSVKISFFGPFGIDLAHALITDKNFVFYNVINNTVYRGKQKSGAMKEILKVDIPFEDLIDIATGTVDLSDKLSREPDQTETIDDLIKLTYTDSLKGVFNSFYVQSDRLEVRQMQMTGKNGKKLIDVKYSNFRKIDDIPVTSKIVYDGNAENEKIRIEYTKIDINNGLNGLNIEIPNDAKIIEW